MNIIKEITPVFQHIGRRRKLIGFDAFLNGRFIGVYSTRSDALLALDKIAFEMLVAA